MTKDNGVNRLIGILSWNVDCAEEYPDVYTNVFSHASWIEHMIDSSVEIRRETI